MTTQPNTSKDVPGAKIIAMFPGACLVDEPAGMDWTQPCGEGHQRPDHLRGKLVQGSRTTAFLSCNRPHNHPGNHQILTDSFYVLIEWGQP